MRWKPVFIQTNADVMGGTTVFSGSRVPVRTFVEYLQAGETIDDFLEGFPTVGRDRVLAVFSRVPAKRPGLNCTVPTQQLNLSH